jgi:hypothetical protein
MKIDDETLITADVARKAMDQVRKYTEAILLKRKWDPARAGELARTLASHAPLTLRDVGTQEIYALDFQAP